MKAHNFCSHFRRWTADEKARWESLSQNGRIHYVIVNGIVMYGGFCAVGWNLLWDLSYGEALAFDKAFWRTVPLWLLGGYVYGELTWWGTSRSYAERFGESTDQ